MSNVQDAIQAAAGRFASEVVSLLRGATLADILSLTGKSATFAHVADGKKSKSAGPSEKPKARRARSAGKKRSREEVAKLAEKVMNFLGTVKDEIGVSGIAEALKVNTADLGLPLSKLRQEGKIKTRGQKRSTVYRLA